MMEQTGGAMLFSIIPLLMMIVYIGIIGFSIYVAITALKRMKERNEYLKDIRDVLKQRNEE